MFKEQEKISMIKQKDASLGKERFYFSKTKNTGFVLV